jgi:hypothetical protein
MKRSANSALSVDDFERSGSENRNRATGLNPSVLLKQEEHQETEIDKSEESQHAFFAHKSLLLGMVNPEYG